MKLQSILLIPRINQKHILKVNLKITLIRFSINSELMTDDSRKQRDNANPLMELKERTLDFLVIQMISKVELVQLPCNPCSMLNHYQCLSISKSVKHLIKLSDMITLVTQQNLKRIRIMKYLNIQKIQRIRLQK